MRRAGHSSGPAGKREAGAFGSCSLGLWSSRTAMPFCSQQLLLSWWYTRILCWMRPNPSATEPKTALMPKRAINPALTRPRGVLCHLLELAQEAAPHRGLQRAGKRPRGRLAAAGLAACKFVGAAIKESGMGQHLRTPSVPRGARRRTSCCALHQRVPLPPPTRRLLQLRQLAAPVQQAVLIVFICDLQPERQGKGGAREGLI